MIILYHKHYDTVQETKWRLATNDVALRSDKFCYDIYWSSLMLTSPIYGIWKLTNSTTVTVRRSARRCSCEERSRFEVTVARRDSVALVAAPTNEPALVSLCFTGCFATRGTLKQKTRLLTYITIASKRSRNLF